MRAQPAVSELPQTAGAQVPSLSDSPEDKNVPAGRPANQHANLEGPK